MARWKLLSDEIAQKTWDEELLRLDDYSPYQTYAWSQYRRVLGWEPCFWAAFDDNGQVVAMLLGGLRRYPLGLGLVWSEGGPVGDLSACDESLQEAMRQTTGLKRLYCRFRCDRERHVEDALRLGAQGWCRAWSPLTTSYSIGLDLDRSEDEILAACSGSWRRNLRLSWKNNLTVRRWENPNADEAIAVFASMQKVKNLGEQYSREELEAVFNTLSERLVLYRCDDEEGQLLSLSGCLVVGDCAMSWLVACNQQGRKRQAAYAVFWGVVKHCLNLQIKELDLAGIDPIRNPGTYQFKRASGATPIEYLGEWDWASSSWLRWLGNWAISRRERLKIAESALKSSSRIAHSKTPFEGRHSGAELSQPTTV